MSAKIPGIIASVILLLSGLSIMLDPKQYSWLYKYTFDFSEAKWIFGTFLILSGVVFLIFSLRKKDKELEPNYTICPSCLQPYFGDETKDNKCPKCNGELENLDGFYERHPELKDKG